MSKRNKVSLIVRHRDRTGTRVTTLRLPQALLDRIHVETAGSRGQVLIELLRASFHARKHVPVQEIRKQPLTAICVPLTDDLVQHFADLPAGRSMRMEAELRLMHALDLLAERATPLVIE